MHAIQTRHITPERFNQAARIVKRFAQTFAYHVDNDSVYVTCKSMLTHCLGGEDWTDEGRARHETLMQELAGILGL